MLLSFKGSAKDRKILMLGCGSNQGRPASASAEIEHQQAFLVDYGPRGPGIGGTPQFVEYQDRTVETGADQDVVPGSLQYADGAECEAKDSDAHFALLEELSESIFADRDRPQLPYY